MSDGRKHVCRKITAALFVDHRGWTELVALSGSVAAFAIWGDVSDSIGRVLTEDVRQALYEALAATFAALLGFVLAALAVLVALPSTERVESLRRHAKWDRVPSAYLRASRALLLTLVLCLLGIAVDDGFDPRVGYESAVAGLTAVSLIRVLGCVAVLDHVLAVAQAPLREKVRDP